jgi:hemerythrin-like domain-containing protein
VFVPVFGKAWDSRGGRPIGVMLTEHKIMRGIISRLEKSFNDYLLTGSGLENALPSAWIIFFN